MSSRENYVAEPDWFSSRTRRARRCTSSSSWSSPSSSTAVSPGSSRCRSRTSTRPSRRAPGPCESCAVASELAVGDVIYQVAGHPIEGVVLVADGSEPIRRLDRLVDIDGEAIRGDYEIDLYGVAATDDDGNPITKRFTFDRAGETFTVEGESLGALGIDVVEPDRLVETGGFRSSHGMTARQSPRRPCPALPCARPRSRCSSTTPRRCTHRSTSRSTPASTSPCSERRGTRIFGFRWVSARSARHRPSRAWLTPDRRRKAGSS